MPRELTLIEEFDVIAELQFPDFVYSTDSLEEKIAFGNFMLNLSERRIVLLDNDIFDFPFAVAGLKEKSLEIIMREGNYDLKNDIIFNLLFYPEFLKQVSDFADELDKRGRTTENSTRLKNILQYLRDNRFVV